jgi:hypothetical protein
VIVVVDIDLVGDLDGDSDLDRDTHLDGSSTRGDQVHVAVALKVHALSTTTSVLHGN